MEVLGPEYADSRKPPFEGMVLTVVGFEPRYVNQVVVQQPCGCQGLLPTGGREGSSAKGRAGRQTGSLTSRIASEPSEQAARSKKSAQCHRETRQGAARIVGATRPETAALEGFCCHT
jgi:hypothetical protein